MSASEYHYDQQKIMERLEILERKCDQDGEHVRANTVWLAMAYIRQLEARVETLEATTVYEDGQMVPHRGSKL